MSDCLTKEQRSALMSRIVGDNLKPESRLKTLVTGSKEIGSFVFNANLPGKPDIMVALHDDASAKGWLCVFVHGCFWHRCMVHYRAPKTRADHWRRHIEKNVARDRRVRRALNRLGYRTMVVWEHETKTIPKAAAAVARIVRRLKGTK